MNLARQIVVARAITTGSQRRPPTNGSSRRTSANAPNRAAFRTGSRKCLEPADGAKSRDVEEPFECSEPGPEMQNDQTNLGPDNNRGISYLQLYSCPGLSPFLQESFRSRRRHATNKKCTNKATLCFIDVLPLRSPPIHFLALRPEFVFSAQPWKFGPEGAYKHPQRGIA
jgi:hypothetical protein